MSEVKEPVKITLPDGSSKTFESKVTPYDVAESISKGLAKASVAAKINGEIADLSQPIESDSEVALLTNRDEEALEVLRHSCTHLMAQAIKRLFPDAMLEDGPPTEDGFWYDIKTDPPITVDDFPKIEKEMEKIIQEKLPIERSVLSREEARTVFEERKEKYKLDLIERIPEGDTISVYRQGEFVDLCRGPHVPHTGMFKAFKLMSVAGAYWKGDAANDQLSRVKGTAFFSKSDLKDYLNLLEEARKRDHRKLGRDLELFMHHEWAPGETIWLSNGFTVYTILKNMMSELCKSEGYIEVFTPMLFKKDLFETSGHWHHYRDDMFVVPGQESKDLSEEEIKTWSDRILAEAESDLPAHEWASLEGKLKDASSTSESLSIMLSGSPTLSTRHWNIFEKAPGEFVHLTGSGREVYAIKPMNCPCHMLIFGDKKRSYRELPLRIHDQGVLHRNEASGTLSGITRVRQFCQDDAHIFLTQEQIENEITNLISLVKRVYNVFGMEFSQIFLSTRPDDFLGEKETWDQAENALANSIRNNGLEYTINEGDGAFYGPKIDFMVRDCLRREWQTATIQLDYQLPQRFGLKYINSQNEEETPVVVHRAIYGTFERFLGILIEHYGGNFPTWLAPEQVRILTISEKFNDYGQEIFETLKEMGVRVELDGTAEKIGHKIRLGRNMRIPWLLIVGEREREERTLSVRSQIEGDLGSMPLDSFLTKIDELKEASF